MEILSFAFYKEEVERLLQVLSKEAKAYLNENQDMIDVMKSMIEYEFNLNSRLDRSMMSKLNLQCADLTVDGNFSDQAEANEALKILANIQNRYSSTTLKKLVMPLTSPLSYSFIGQCSMIYTLNHLELTKSNSTILYNLLAQHQLKLQTLTLTLPESGVKPIQLPQLNQQSLFTNDSIRTLNLNFPSSIDNNYLDFTKLLLKNKSISTLTLYLSNKQFINDINLTKYFACNSRLYKLVLKNFQFSNKNSYIQFCLFLGQNSSIQEIELRNVQMFDKLKQTFYNCLNDRRQVLNSFINDNCAIDGSNILGIAKLIEKNPLRHLQILRSMSNKQLMLPVHDIIGAIANKNTLQRLIIVEPQVKIGESFIKAAQKSFATIKSLQRLELQFENYDYLFGQLTTLLQVKNLSVNASSIDKLGINKLFYDIHTSILLIDTIKLTGGFQDQHISKLLYLTNKIKELDLSCNQISDEGAYLIGQLLQKSRTLQKLDISSNMITDIGISSIFSNGQQPNTKLLYLKLDSAQLKKKGRVEVLKGFSNLQNLKELDLSQFVMKHLDEAEILASYLRDNQQIEKISMPRLQIEDEEQCKEAVYLVFGSLIHSRSLIHASLTFFIKVMIAYDFMRKIKQEVYSLKALTLKSLNVINCNLNQVLYEAQNEASQIIQEFIDNNPNLWIKNTIPQRPTLKEKLSRSFLSRSGKD